jgi:hypothetical protein
MPPELAEKFKKMGATITVPLLGAVGQATFAEGADPEIEFGFLLHDIGKVAVPDAILNKPGPLDDSECSPGSATIGGFVLGDYCGGLTLFDPEQDRWRARASLRSRVDRSDARLSTCPKRRR